jgi:hypothetical protein
MYAKGKLNLAKSKKFRQSVPIGHDTFEVFPHTEHSSVCTQIRLILPAGTAIGVRLSHASREG